MLWQKVIATYNSLPEDERTSVRIAAQLRAEGHEVHATQVCKVLKHTVLEDSIDSRELLATAKVLQTLVDFTIGGEHPDTFEPDISSTIDRVTDGLGLLKNSDYKSIDQIRNALSHIVNFYYMSQERYQCHSDSDPQEWGRYILRNRSPHIDDEFPF